MATFLGASCTACGAESTRDGGGARGKTGDGGAPLLVKTLLISSLPANETIMLITLSHCVVVRTFLVLGCSSSEVVLVGGSGGGPACFT